MLYRSKTGIIKAIQWDCTRNAWKNILLLDTNIQGNHMPKESNSSLKIVIDKQEYIIHPGMWVYKDKNNSIHVCTDTEFHEIELFAMPDCSVQPPKFNKVIEGLSLDINIKGFKSWWSKIMHTKK